MACHWRRASKNSSPNAVTRNFSSFHAVPFTPPPRTGAGQLITGGWDSTLRCWDPRASVPALLLLKQAERVYSLSLVAHHLVVAMAGRHVAVYDLRHMAQPEQVRESSLKFQTRCVRCYPNGTGAMGGA